MGMPDRVQARVELRQVSWFLAIVLVATGACRPFPVAAHPQGTRPTEASDCSTPPAWLAQAATPATSGAMLPFASEPPPPWISETSPGPSLQAGAAPARRPTPAYPATLYLQPLSPETGLPLRGPAPPPPTTPALSPGQPPLPAATGPLIEPASSSAASAATETLSLAGSEADDAALDQLVNVDLRETDLKVFVKVLAERTHTNWLFDPGLAGKVTLLGPGRMTCREALHLLRSILEFKDLTVESVGRVNRIVPRNQGRFRNTELRLGPFTASASPPLSEDALVTQYVRLKHRAAAELRSVLLNFCRDGAAILPYPPANGLFITDNGTYIHRLMQLVAELDAPDTSRRLEIFPLKFAFAKAILQPLTEILKHTRDLRIGPETALPAAPAPPEEPGEPVALAPPSPGPGVPVTPTLLIDEADNRLLAVALPGDLEAIRKAIGLLDHDPGHVPQMRWLPLRHSDPETVSNLASQAYKSDPSNAGSVKSFTILPDKRTGSLLITSYSPAMLERVAGLVQKLDLPMLTVGTAVRVYKLEYAEAQKVAEVLNGLGESVGEISTSVVGSSSTTSPSTGRSGKPSTPVSSADRGTGKSTTVIADEATNSLVIVATREKFDQLSQVIRELDVVRPQVLVEILIVRIDVDRARHLGLDFNAVEAGGGHARPFAIGSSGQLGSLFSSTGVRSGLNLGLLDSGNFDLSAAARGDLSQLTKIGVLINVLSTDSRANILSAPKLLTGDNQEAKLTVGSQVRIPQGSTLNAINSITNFVTEDLGVMIQLTPRITKNDFVAMKIKTQIKNLIPNQAVAGLPVISNSDLETNLTVANRATLAMGGLIQEEERQTVIKLPLLGSLPLLGKLFSDTLTNKTKSNLLVFMSPHIIRSSEMAREETRRISPVLRFVEIKAGKRGNREDAGALLTAMNQAR